MKVRPLPFESLCRSLNNKIFTGDEQSNHIDMILNPDKISQYQMDVAEAMKDIRDKRQQLFTSIVRYRLNNTH